MKSSNRAYDLEKIVETLAFNAKLLGREADADLRIRKAICMEDESESVAFAPTHVFGWNRGFSFDFEPLSANNWRSAMARTPVVAAPSRYFNQHRSMRIQLNNFPYRSMISCSEMLAQQVRRLLGQYIHGPDFWLDPQRMSEDGYMHDDLYLVNNIKAVREGVEVRVYPSSTENRYFAVFTVWYTTTNSIPDEMLDSPLERLFDAPKEEPPVWFVD